LSADAAGVVRASVAEWRKLQMYASGQGVPQDFALAHMWFNIVAVGRRAAACTPLV
jgi:TPR repeat protein